MPPEQRAAALHAPLIVLLVALRPLLWDGGWGDAPSLAWQALVLVGCACAAIEIARGAAAPRFGAVGIAAVVALALLAPAALRSPLHADGFATWGVWAIHGAFAWWLAFAARGRERLLAGALVAGLAGEAAYALGQRHWSLPALERRIAAGDAPTVPGVSLDDLHERVTRGGVFGTFTQGNALGAFLALAVPVAAAIAWRRGTVAARIIAGLAAIAGVGVLATTDSKGTWLALACALVMAATLRARGAWRVAPPLALAALACAVLALPRARAALTASADVRVDYWRGAATLIAERPLVGHGVRGFAVGYPRTMPIAAEPTRYAHCEPIEAAVDGGVPAALAVVALLALLVARAAEPAAERDAPNDASPIERWAPVALLITPAYAHLFGAIDVADWPGTQHAAVEMAWMVAFGGLLAATCAIARLAPPPPRAACAIGLAAAALHACIDYDLHAGGVLGTLVVVACLAARGEHKPVGSAWRVAIGAATLAAIASFAFGASRSLALRWAQDAVTAARAVMDAPAPSAEAAARARRRLATLAEVPADRPIDELLASTRDAALAACLAWPRAEPDIELDVLSLWPPGAERLPLIESARVADPGSARAAAMQAGDLATVGRWDEALDAQRASVALSPAYVPARLRLAALEREAARRLPSSRAELTAAADAAEAAARRLQEIVDPRDRAR